jgi:thiol-disulfide isomerase/thioredoxin
MKKIVFAAMALFTGYGLFAQTEVTVEPGGTKIIKGFTSRQELATDTSFKWFAENQKGYTPDPNALALLKANRDSINVIVFGGTWCGDTKYILPKFFSLADAAGFPQDRITVVGVDRNKKTIQHLAEAFGVVNVPTIIVMKNGKEAGRVVEYGKYGLYDKELGEILSHK